MGSGASKSSINDDEQQQRVSGVTLSPELEADIIRDFQSKVLQEEWNKFGTSILVHRNERLQKLQQATQQYQHERQLHSIQYQQRMEELDNSIDTMQATITDQLVENEYDVQKLLHQYSHWIPSPSTNTTNNDIISSDASDEVRDSKPLPCLGERAHWIDCQKKYSVDSRPCNYYVQALEQCVHRTMFGGNSQ